MNTIPDYSLEHSRDYFLNDQIRRDPPSSIKTFHRSNLSVKTFISEISEPVVDSQGKKRKGNDGSATDTPSQTTRGCKAVSARLHIQWLEDNRMFKHPPTAELEYHKEFHNLVLTYAIGGEAPPQNHLTPYQVEHWLKEVAFQGKLAEHGVRELFNSLFDQFARTIEIDLDTYKPNGDEDQVAKAPPYFIPQSELHGKGKLQMKTLVTKEGIVHEGFELRPLPEHYDDGQKTLAIVDGMLTLVSESSRPCRVFQYRPYIYDGIVRGMDKKFESICRNLYPATLDDLEKPIQAKNFHVDVNIHDEIEKWLTQNACPDGYKGFDKSHSDFHPFEDVLKELTLLKDLLDFAPGIFAVGIIAEFKGIEGKSAEAMVQLLRACSCALLAYAYIYELLELLQSGVAPKVAQERLRSKSQKIFNFREKAKSEQEKAAENGQDNANPLGGSPDSRTSSPNQPPRGSRMSQSAFAKLFQKNKASPEGRTIKKGLYLYFYQVNQEHFRVFCNWIEWVDGKTFIRMSELELLKLGEKNDLPKIMNIMFNLSHWPGTVWRKQILDLLWAFKAVMRERPWVKK